MVPTFGSERNFQIKATEYFAVMLHGMLYMVVLTVESVDEILKCDHPD